MLVSQCSKKLAQPSEAGKYLVNLVRKKIDKCDKAKEIVLVLGVKSNLVLKYADVVHIGSVRESFMVPADIFRRAIVEGCASIIIAHTHPSGNLSPSDNDITTTQKMIESGRLLGISVLDHFIITNNSYMSIRETHPSLWEGTDA